MKKTILTTVAALSVLCTFAQWKPVGDKIKTPWAEKVDPANVLPEYPRPQMVRSQWVNLNGLWDYAIKPVGAMEPKTMDGKILVPFAVESSLSGVQKGLTEKDELWYRRTFSVPAAWKGSNVLLNFGAVDWKADVFVNDILAGSHTGGFTPFSLDITPLSQGQRRAEAGRTRVRRHGQGIPAPRKAGADPQRHLVHAGQRHLADRVDRTGGEEPHLGHQGHSQPGPEEHSRNRGGRKLHDGRSGGGEDPRQG